MSEPTIYNCHIHTFTTRHVPRNFVSVQVGLFLGRVIGALMQWSWFIRFIIWIAERISPKLNDIFERQARFLRTGAEGSQKSIFMKIEKQYPRTTKFVVLPMNMEQMGVGKPISTVDEQHEELLQLAKSPALKDRILPFYAVDPRHKNILDLVKTNLGENKFRGIKLYPNLGYYPNDPRLIKIYEFCQQGGYPVMTHCSPDGIWGLEVTQRMRRRYAHPKNYEMLLKVFPKLHLCLAHFGGASEWRRHLKSRRSHEGPYRTWVRWIADMISSGDYPTLFTDIAYTAFVPRVEGLYIDLIDYLKVLLTNEKIREHVLFGSDYYMVEREEMSEKEASILLRSRLGEELFFQIANKNPKAYLGIS